MQCRVAGSPTAGLLAEVARAEPDLDHAGLVALGGDPAASFAIVAAPGYSFSDARTGDPAMAASLIAYGPHIAHADLGTVDMIDLAPTLAALLGVALPTAVGKPIDVLVQTK